MSKLPNVTTSIFTKMSQLSAEHGALNLAQGFPDFAVSNQLIDLVTDQMKKGRNQYPPSIGIPKIRQAIVEMHKVITGTDHDPDAEVTITSGATEALFSSMSALFDRGDEVIVFDPAYDSYEPVINLQGAVAIHCQLRAPDFRVNWDKVRSKISNKTKGLVINTPHNPTGMVMSNEDMLELEKIVVKYDLIVISDEVYNHIVFDGVKHKSVLQYPELAARSVAIFSFGKTFHATGWKIGYAIAPAHLTDEIRKVHQFVTFTTHTPGQFALADFMADSSNYTYLPGFFQKKRDYFLEGIKDSRFKGSPSSGTYFQMLSYDDISDESDTNMADRLTIEFKLASIPISVFYGDGYDPKHLRFCFAKEENTLDQAIEIMNKI